MKSTETIQACLPLINPKLHREDNVANRVLCFDPTEVYLRLGSRVDHFKRIQNTLEMGIMFPQVEKSLCACGCGTELSGRRSRWANDECSRFAFGVFAIIQGRSEYIARYIRHIAGDYNGCMGCGDVLDSATSVKRMPWEHDMELDHVLAVKCGGGGCWLGNYQQLCIPCHDKKSKIDGSAIRLIKRKQTSLL